MQGRCIIGWDEILEGGIPDEAVVMCWRGTIGGVAAAKHKHKVIMTPNTRCYFDYRQSGSMQARSSIQSRRSLCCTVFQDVWLVQEGMAPSCVALSLRVFCHACITFV